MNGSYLVIKTFSVLSFFMENKKKLKNKLKTIKIHKKGHQQEKIL